MRRWWARMPAGNGPVAPGHPRGWNTAVGLAADLQLASAFPGTHFVEYLTGSPFIDELAIGGWKLDTDGMIEIPGRPGLGIELNRDALEKYAGNCDLLT